MMIMFITMECCSFYISFLFHSGCGVHLKNKTEDDEYQIKLKIAAELCKQIIPILPNLRPFAHFST